MNLALTMTAIHGTFPVGSFVKALPALPSQPFFTGEVIANDGVEFKVKWDFTEIITTFNVADEAAKAAAGLEKASRWLSQLT